MMRGNSGPYCRRVLPGRHRIKRRSARSSRCWPRYNSKADDRSGNVLVDVVITRKQVGDILGDGPGLEIEHFALGIIAAVLVDGNGLLIYQPNGGLRIGDPPFGITIDHRTAVV